MTVYKVTTKKHFQKIANFLESQPKLSPQIQHFRKMVIGENKPLSTVITSAFFEKMRQKDKTLDILVVEDANGEIRLVFTRGKRVGAPQFKTEFFSSVGMVMRDADFTAKNLEYVDELTQWIAHFNIEVLGIKESRFGLPAALMKFKDVLYGDALEVTGNPVTVPIYGTYYLVRVNWEKYLK